MYAGCATTGARSVKWTATDVPYGADPLQTFNMTLPPGKSAVHAIVYVHGGFYFGGNKLWYPAFLSEFTGSNLVASIDHRLLETNNGNLTYTFDVRPAVTMDEMLADMEAALRQIEATALAQGVTVEDFILIGHSAGAHLALLYAYKNWQHYEHKPVAVIVEMSGPTDYTDDFGWSSMSHYGSDLSQRMTFLTTIGSVLTNQLMILNRYDYTNLPEWEEMRPAVEAISPVYYVTEGAQLPATLLVHALDDKCVPYSNAVKLYDALVTRTPDVPHALWTSIGKVDNNHMLGGSPNAINSKVPITYKDDKDGDNMEAYIKEWLQEYVEY
jgi:acetyl esterase/lipase